jgi:hypothetical protein
MAHFAKLNEQNVVIDVVVVHNDDIQNLEFPESESIGVSFLTSLFNYSLWKQTSYNSSFRANYATIDGWYDPVKDVFIPRKPFPSWVLNETTVKWEAPIPYPVDDNDYYWDETSGNWKTYE